MINLYRRLIHAFFPFFLFASFFISIVFAVVIIIILSNQKAEELRKEKSNRYFLFKRNAVFLVEFPLHLLKIIIKRKL